MAKCHDQMLSYKLRGDVTFENRSVHPLRKLRGLKHDQRHHDCLKNKMLSKVKISQKSPPWFLMYEGQQQGKLIYDVRIVVILKWLGEVAVSRHKGTRKGWEKITAAVKSTAEKHGNSQIKYKKHIATTPTQLSECN